MHVRRYDGAMNMGSARVRAVAGSLAIHALLAFIVYWGWLIRPEVNHGNGFGRAIMATLLTVQPRHAVLPADPAASLPSQAARAPAVTAEVVRSERAASPAGGRASRMPSAAPSMPGARKSAPSFPLEAMASPPAQAIGPAARAPQTLADDAGPPADASIRVQLIEPATRSLVDRKNQLAHVSPDMAPAPAAQGPASPSPVASADAVGSTGSASLRSAASSSPVAPADAAGVARSAYIEALQDALLRQWRTIRVPAGVHCRVWFRQQRGGQVILPIRFDDCPVDDVARTSVADAISRMPLPYAGFERYFVPLVAVDLCHPAARCAP